MNCFEYTCDIKGKTDIELNPGILKLISNSHLGISVPSYYAYLRRICINCSVS